MELGYELSLKQTQKLAMTHELIQAIQILQCSSQELSEYVDKELMENPVLERKSESEIHKETAELKERNDELQKEKDFIESLIEADYDDISYKQWQYDPNASDDTYYQEFVQEDESLVDFLMSQLNFTKLSEQDKNIGKYLVEAIDSDGYLCIELESIAKRIEESVEKLEEILDVIQTFEPHGVGARSLNECIIIQLASKGQLTEELEYIVTNMLEDIANNKMAYIAKVMGITPKIVQDYCDILKTLDPKPGRTHGPNRSTKHIVPDIFVEKVNGQYVVTSNENNSPKLMISSYYNKLKQNQRDDKELEKYLSEKLNSAIWLIKAIRQRKTTIHSIACEIVKYQEDFFEYGSKQLKKMTLKQIAEEVGVHESTVSRAINGKYIQTKQGAYELKYFFSSGLSQAAGEDVSSNSVKTLIKEIIDKEDTSKPLSDQQIAEMLVGKGIDISRRTVAKYREGIGILSSSKRKRF